LTTVILEASGGEHTQTRCPSHAHQHSRNFGFKQRIAVSKVVKVNPKATTTDVRRALQHLSPSNDDTVDFHFSDPHKVFCIGNVAPDAEGEEIYLASPT
jgi:hypothetical protein